MKPVTVTRCSLAQFMAEPALADLFAAYAAECAIAGLGTPNPCLAAYQQMEHNGALHLLAAHRGGRLIGFLTFLVTVLPHYGKLVASVESFFVGPDERTGGAGLKLLREAESIAREKEAAGIFASAPTASRLDSMLPALGYRHTNQVFFRGLRHE